MGDRTVTDSSKSAMLNRTVMNPKLSFQWYIDVCRNEEAAVRITWSVEDNT